MWPRVVTAEWSGSAQGLPHAEPEQSKGRVEAACTGSPERNVYELDCGLPERNLMALAQEDRFLTLCSRVHLSDTAGEQVEEILQSPLNWDYVRVAAVGHAVAPLLHRSL